MGSGTGAGEGTRYIPAVSESKTRDRKIWVDGSLVAWESATVHLLSHSLQRGSLIFDYLSVHETVRGPAIFRLREHVERFLRSAELVGLPLKQDVAAIEAATLETVRANPGAHSVKMSAYIPSLEIDVVPQNDHVALAIAAYDPAADIAAHNPGKPHFRSQLKLWIEKVSRNRRADIVPPQAKVAANYVSPMVAKWKARRAGYDEIVLVDEEGNLAEGPTTNLFLIDRAGVVRTPPEDHVLLGVTRRSIIDLAKHFGHEVVEAPIRPEALFEASEVFLTGTTAGVWPVESVDGKAIGEVCPGPVSLALREHFVRVTEGRDADFDHWLTYVDAK